MNKPLFLGWDSKGRRVLLSAEDRSTHVMIVGAPNFGKSTCEEFMLRQDLAAGRGCADVDPMQALYDSTIQYALYLRKFRKWGKEPILFDPSNPDWVLPFNPFERGPGDVATQVDRRIQATLKAWGQHVGDDTPRLEKWLRCIYTALIEKGFTILEAGYLVDVDPKVRAYLTNALQSEVVRVKFGQLASYRLHDFLSQVESTESRMMRFTPEDAVGRSMGIGRNALNYRQLMDEAGVLFVNLATGDFLSQPQQRLFGTMLVSQFYEAAMRRRSGSRPFYLYLDEASLFVVPELGHALDHCRQKGLHITFAFQHLSQFREEDPLVYKSVKNSAQTKIIFRVNDRVDALEIADDIFLGLTKPKTKHVNRHLAHHLTDEWIDARSATHGRSRSAGGGRVKTETVTRGKTCGSGFSYAESEAESENDESGHTDVEGSNYSETFVDSETEGFSLAKGESESWQEGESDSETTTRQFFTRHEPFLEETSRTFYSLEERRWQAAEILMTLPTGCAIVKRPNGRALFVRVPKPKAVRMKPERFFELKDGLHAVHSIPRVEADRIIQARREELRRAALAHARRDHADTFQMSPKSRRK